MLVLLLLPTCAILSKITLPVIFKSPLSLAVRRALMLRQFALAVPSAVSLAIIHAFRQDTLREAIEPDLIKFLAGCAWLHFVGKPSRASNVVRLASAFLDFLSLGEISHRTFCRYSFIRKNSFVLGRQCHRQIIMGKSRKQKTFFYDT
jgi:hypothetical protein